MEDAARKRLPEAVTVDAVQRKMNYQKNKKEDKKELCICPIKMDSAKALLKLL